MKIIIAKTILALCWFACVLWVITNPLLEVSGLEVLIGFVIAWAVSEVVND